MKKFVMAIFFCQGMICATGITHESFETLEHELTDTNAKIAQLSTQMKQLQSRVSELELQRTELNARLLLK